MELLPLIALVISALVAISQLSKEYRERKALTAKEKASKYQAEENQALLPIRGANEAVLALQAALKSSVENEQTLRHRIGNLEISNENKDDEIDEIKKCLWDCQRRLDKLEERKPDNG